MVASEFTGMPPVWNPCVLLSVDSPSGLLHDVTPPRGAAAGLAAALCWCSSTCGKGLQSRVVQCMHKVTGRHGSECPALSKPAAYRQCYQEVCNDKINANTITSPRLAALTYKCTRDQWTVYCRVIREKNLCQDMRWYQRCCQTCRDFYANKMRQLPPPSS
ncbi:A disintegrin and metalloproteinase with thrombospondin motifs 17-like [Microcebus murinus]|uniref:A disintegrin and metalloproteinase with thrombospondin motifs 17-like n=1 Tax=Microcebus murinus TaxID=30608 RepID=UPI003F6B3783